jgi:8-amino-7-oxononanoate synthase
VLAELKEKNLYRIRKEISQRKNINYCYNGKHYLSFCSNDYLGLSHDLRVINAFKHGAERYGVGSTASAMISGYTTAHRELEEQFADYLQRDKAIFFASGYMANLGVMKVFADRHDLIYQDKLNHASLLDAAKLSNAKLKRYKHLDMSHLTSLIENSTAKNKLIAAEGVYSMAGDISPLPELVKIAKNSNALLMIDDAHGIGILGKNGCGTVEHFSLSQHDVPILVCPLGKALGGVGGIVAGNSDLIEQVLQLARTYTYTTNAAPAMACALLASLQIIKTESWRRQKLMENINYFKQGIKQRELPYLNSETAIQSIIIGTEKDTCALSDELLKKEILVYPVRPPTVPRNTSRLRITLSCEHNVRQIDYLLDSLLEAYNNVLSNNR